MSIGSDPELQPRTSLSVKDQQGSTLLEVPQTVSVVLSVNIAVVVVLEDLP